MHVALALPVSAQSEAQHTERYLQSIAGDQALLVDFLTRMPKGGDLHHHLTGAVYAESYIDYAVEDGDCIDRASLRIVAPPCDPERGTVPATQALDDFVFRNRVIDAWSIRDFVPSADDPDVRRHFFATFGKFDLVTNGHWGEMLAEVVARAGPDHAPLFTLEAEVEGVEPAVAEGGSVRAAEKAAALILLRRARGDA